MMSANAHQNADHDERPRHVAAHDALGEHGHQSGLRSRELTVTKTDAAAVDVGLVEQHQHEEQREAGNGDAEEVAELHLARSAAEDVSDFQVLQHFARDRRGNADDGGDAEHGGDARHARRRR